MVKNARDTDDHDRALELLILLVEDWRAAGISDADALLAVGDFLVLSLLGAGRENGVGELAVEATIARMQDTLQAWREGKHPFEDFNGKPE